MSSMNYALPSCSGPPVPHICCPISMQGLSPTGSETKFKISPGVTYHDVPPEKLEQALEANFEDELPFLCTYTTFQQELYNLERATRTTQPKEPDQEFPDGPCLLGTKEFYLPKPPKKKPELTDEIVSRTIFDEIPFLGQEFVTPQVPKRKRNTKPRKTRKSNQVHCNVQNCFYSS
ncbi:uncharacterized protein LOC131670947 [Phymastichus coffea]|uniref:uncharacterized protein LOC131670947 n=1 Tax=Phymastichus coffea TaxID=108790 RepID=UPI00273ABA5C|nr:uncharacterized protein LOC131670947 [Phymastichus coffea]